MMVRSKDYGIQKMKVHLPPLPFPIQMALKNLLNLYEPQFSHLSKRNDVTIYFIWLLQWLIEMIHTKHLAYSKCVTNDSDYGTLKFIPPIVPLVLLRPCPVPPWSPWVHQQLSGQAASTVNIPSEAATPLFSAWGFFWRHKDWLIHEQWLTAQPEATINQGSMAPGG